MRVRIGHRQGEPGPVQQIAGVPHLGQRRQAWAQPALDRDLGLDQCLAQLAAGTRRPALPARNNPSGLRSATDLDQCAPGRSLTPVQVEATEDEVETSLGEGQGFLVGGDRQGLTGTDSAIRGDRSHCTRVSIPPRPPSRRPSVPVAQPRSRARGKVCV